MSTGGLCIESCYIQVCGAENERVYTEQVDLYIQKIRKTVRKFEHLHTSQMGLNRQHV